MTAQQLLTDAQELLDGLKALHEEQAAGKNPAQAQGKGN